MKTLTEIENDEHKTRERAHGYEKALAERDRLAASDAAMHKMDFSAMPVLEAMREAVLSLPKTLVTRGTRFLAGGFVARDLLQQIINGMLGDLETKRQARDQILAVNAKKRASVERTLAELEAQP